MEYKGYNIRCKGMLMAITPVKGGAMPNALRGLFTSAGDAQKAIDRLLEKNSKAREANMEKSKARSANGAARTAKCRAKKKEEEVESDAKEHPATGV